MTPQINKTTASFDLDDTDNVSDEFAAPGYPGVSVQVVYTGAATSPTVTLQASNDGTNFDDITGYTSAALAGAGTFGWQLDMYSFTYYRVKVSSAGSAGSAIAYFNANGGN